MEDNWGILVKGAHTPLELCDDRGLSESFGGSVGTLGAEPAPRGWSSGRHCSPAVQGKLRGAVKGQIQHSQLPGAPAVGLVVSQLPPTAADGEYGQGR